MESRSDNKLSNIVNRDIGEKFYLNLIKKRGRWIVILSIALITSVIANCLLGVEAKQSSEIIEINNSRKLNAIENHIFDSCYYFEKAIECNGYQRMLFLEKTRNQLEAISDNMRSTYNNEYSKTRRFFDIYILELDDWISSIVSNRTENIPNEIKINNYLDDFRNISNKFDLAIDCGNNSLSYEQIDFNGIVDQLIDETKSEDIKEHFKVWFK
ncbi:hypothetical protein [Abyssisolibacter fermentans]|uniref:hypothetical protein n=1 Tax=Abyssisolibacter fermentans TaxID=1766203 RepID=UPI000832B8A1|nr:hypothetical protein [Abyssisolibacter fermentans]